MKETIQWAMENKNERTELMISFRPYSAVDRDKFEDLIEEAAQDKYLGDFVYTRKREDFVGFWSGKKLVGFAVPRKDSDGRYRTGAIFVTPDRRRDGIAAAFVKQYFENKKGRAYVNPENAASVALYTSAGFHKSGKVIQDDQETLEEYLKG